ncbi:hypothetical protein R3P38DRAFT_2539939, partial [Favolaschia claudopus]
HPTPTSTRAPPPPPSRVLAPPRLLSELVPIPPDFEEFDHAGHIIEPCTDTVTHVDELRLEAYGIVVNTRWKIVICICCGKVLTLGDLRRHIIRHFKDLDVPPTLADSIAERFDFDPGTLPTAPTQQTSAIYGLLITPRPHLVCARCGHGFSTPTSFSRHEHKPSCPSAPGDPASFYFSYAFSLYLKSPLNVTPNFRELETTLPLNSLDKDIFFDHEAWNEQVAGLSATTIQSAVEIPQDDPLWQALTPHIKDYSTYIRDSIRQSTTQLMRDIARVGTAQSRSELRAIGDESVDKYGRELQRLLFTVMEAAEGRRTAYAFPLQPNQRDALAALRAALTAPAQHPDSLRRALHTANWSLFSQEKAHGAQSHFVLPINCFLVARSKGESNWRRGSEITQVCARLEWLHRGVVLYQMRKLMADQRMSTKDAHDQVAHLLCGRSDTAYAYIYSCHSLLNSILDEYNDSEVQLGDIEGRSIIFDGARIERAGFKTLDEQLRAEYDRVLALIFHNQTPPADVLPAIELAKLLDNQHNNDGGFCFADIPGNNLTRLATVYAEWLLSDPERRSLYTRTYNGELHWQSAPCADLLRLFEDLREVQVVWAIVSAGPSIRSTEIARQLLRNLNTGAMRNVHFIFNCFTLVGLNEKTSGLRLRRRMTPHAPTYRVATALVHEICVFRPFQRHLIQYFFGAAEGLRYHLYMWPGIKKNFDGGRISSLLGDATEKALGKRLQILDYRKVLTAFCRYIIPKPAWEDFQDHFFDSLQHHSSATSYRKYGVDASTLGGSDPRKIAGCLQACISWQNILGIEDGNPLTLTLPASFATDTQLVPAFLGAQTRRDDLKEVLIPALADLVTQLVPRRPPTPPSSALHPQTALVVAPRRLRDWRKFLQNSAANFRFAQQGELIELLSAGSRPVIAILPCGFGKTLIIFFMIKMYDALLTTVIILPLSGLHIELEEKAKQHGITCMRWTHVRPAAWPIDLHFLTTPRFAVGLAERRRLARIVFDEAQHLVMDLGFRPSMLNFLKALTLPIEYIVSLHEPTADHPKPHMHALVAYINGRIARDYSAEDRAIVYTRSIDDANALAQMFGTTVFTSQTPEHQPELHDPAAARVVTRAEILAGWRRGDCKVLIGTSIVGCGVDAIVRDVAHLDVGRNPIEDAQEAGRGGRDGKHCRATTFGLTNRRVERPDPERDQFGANLMVPWLFSDSCRRLLFSLFLDWVGTTCASLPGAQLCDVCVRHLDDELSDTPAPNPRISSSEDVPYGYPVHPPGYTLPQQYPTPSPYFHHTPPYPPPATSYYPAQLPPTPEPPPPRRQQPPARYEISPLFFPSSESRRRSSSTARDPFAPVTTGGGPPAPQRARAPPPTLAVAVNQQRRIDSNDDWKTLGKKINAALDNLAGCCIVCRLLNRPYDHAWDDCGGQVASRLDARWQERRKEWLKLPKGWCFYCHRPQVTNADGFHPYTEGSPQNCPHRSIIKAAVYTIFRHPTQTNPPLRTIPGVPATDDLEELMRWALLAPPSPPHRSDRNFLRVFAAIATALSLA